MGICYILCLPVSKTEEEIEEILNRKEAQLKEKEGRRKKQAQNVAQKKEKQEENKYFGLLDNLTLLLYPVFHLAEV